MKTHSIHNYLFVKAWLHLYLEKLRAITATTAAEVSTTTYAATAKKGTKGIRNEEEYNKCKQN